MAEARRALAVDDNAANLRLTQAVLEDEDWQVVSAGSAEEALEVAVRGDELDVVLMDIQMPGRGGLDVLPDLQALLPGVPVIALTAYAMPDDRDRFLAAGFAGYIAKPIDVTSFADDVEAIITKARLAAAADEDAASATCSSDP